MYHFWLLSLIKLFVKDFEGFDKFILVAEPVRDLAAGSAHPPYSASGFKDDSATSIFSDSYDTSCSQQPTTSISTIADTVGSDDQQPFSDYFHIIGDNIDNNSYSIIGSNSSSYSDIYATEDAIMAKATSDQAAVLPEGGVPQFDGALSKWKEYEKRAMMFIAKLTLEKKEGEAALMLSAGLTGDAWDEVEDLAAEDLIKPGAATALITRLRRRFKVNIRKELAGDF